jgi:uncharacterized protein (DUF302 family)
LSAVDRLVAVLQAKGMTIFDRIDHAEAAKKAGLSMRASQLLIFGNPKGGTPLMVAAPTVAIDLPFKALAWEDADGKVWLGYIPRPGSRSGTGSGGRTTRSRAWKKRSTP